MFQLLHDGVVEEFATLDDALTASRLLEAEWTILNPNGQVEFDWIDRIGP
jgi:hypothetical protein